jgi:hypothetical protein
MVERKLPKLPSNAGIPIRSENCEETVVLAH